MLVGVDGVGICEDRQEELQPRDYRLDGDGALDDVAAAVDRHTRVDD